MSENTSAEIKTESRPGQAPKKKRKAGRILLVILAAIVLVCAGAYTFLVLRGSRIDLPFGLKAGMSRDEASIAMMNSGFSLELRGYEREDEAYFAPNSVWGPTEKFISLETGKTSASLEFFYKENTEEGTGSRENPGDEFNQLLSMLREKYGAPQYESKDSPDYEWSDLRPNLDLYTVRLDYVNDDTYVLDYRWHKGI